ncbi:MAG: cohesin domain-containing protein [Bellilinea sp.]
MRIAPKYLILFIILLVSIPFARGSAAAQAVTQIGVFEPITAATGVVVEVPVRVQDAVELYAIDIEIRFDPALLAAEDADPATPGIQLGFAGFLDPGLVLYNEVDNQQGTAHFVMTQVNPSEPKNGSGILLVLYLKGMTTGQSDITVSNVQISDRSGNEIPSSGVNSTLKVEASAPAVQPTAIPVLNPTEIQWIPGAAASEVPDSNPQQASETSQQFVPLIEAEEAAAEPGKPSWLAENWWMVLAAVLLVTGLVFYLYRAR